MSRGFSPLDVAFMEYMNRHARGRDRAIPRKKIEADLEVYVPQEIRDKDRLFRAVYARMPICSSPEGLFLPTSPAEVQAFKEYIAKGWGHELAYKRVRVILAHRPELCPVDEHQGELPL